MAKKHLMKVGMLFRTKANIDLSITDFDNSQRYVKVDTDTYFRDYSKEYEVWDVRTIKSDFDLDCKKLAQNFPYDTFEAKPCVILFDEDDKMVECVQMILR